MSPSPNTADRESLRGRDFLRLGDLSAAELALVLDVAAEVKSHRVEVERAAPLRGRNLASLYQKPSLRTRVSFELAMEELGGRAFYLSPHEVMVGKRERERDVALVLSRYVSAISARVFAHKVVEELARWAEVPVINALSDDEHPCQALGDLLTICEWRGSIAGARVAWIGDGNNVARSLAWAAARTGMHLIVASPEGFELTERTLGPANVAAAEMGGSVTQVREPKEAAEGADVLYADIWASMGQEEQVESRLVAFAGYRIDAALLARAAPNAFVMHCLPAHHGEEITSEVAYGERSAIWDQAENRLHAQKALLRLILGGEWR